jgi:methylenetetrahydrofolate reductase (NADPH)
VSLLVPVRRAYVTVQQALCDASYEVLPMRGVEAAVLEHVPTNVPLSITMSARKGVEATVDLAERLARHGYSVTPHLAARMLCSPTHLDEFLDRLDDCGIDRLFVVAGDRPDPAGRFHDSLDVLRFLERRGRRFREVGIGGYPEGHTKIGTDQLRLALIAKARHATGVITQMCFRSSTTVSWARRMREHGVDLPVRVGLPGAVSRAKLARISASVGLGQSARFLAKQNDLLWRFFLPGGYQPDRLVRGLATALPADDHNLVGFHFFTFNEVAQTEAWRQRLLSRLRERSAA